MVATTCPETLLPSYQNVHFCICSSLTLKCVVQRFGIMRLASDKFVVHSKVPWSRPVYSDTGGFEAQFISSCHFSHRSNEIIQRLMRPQNKWKRREASFRFTHSRFFQGPSLSFRDCANNGSSYRLISPTSNLTGRSLFLYLCKDVQLLKPENGWDYDVDSKIYWVRSRDYCFWWRHFTTPTFLVGWLCYRLPKKGLRSHLFCLFVGGAASFVSFFLTTPVYTFWRRMRNGRLVKVDRKWGARWSKKLLKSR